MPKRVRTVVPTIPTAIWWHQTSEECPSLHTPNAKTFQNCDTHIPTTICVLQTTKQTRCTHAMQKAAQDCNTHHSPSHLLASRNCFCNTHAMPKAAQGGHAKHSHNHLKASKKTITSHTQCKRAHQHCDTHHRHNHLLTLNQPLAAHTHNAKNCSCL